MIEGINIDVNVHIAVLEMTVAQSAVRMAQLEAVVQQQQAEIDRLAMLVPTDEEVSDDGEPTR